MRIIWRNSKKHKWHATPNAVKSAAKIRIYFDTVKLAGRKMAKHSKGLPDSDNKIQFMTNIRSLGSVLCHIT